MTRQLPARLGVLTVFVAMAVAWAIRAAETPDFSWVHAITNAHAERTAVDTNGNAYVTGRFSGTASFGTNVIAAAGTEMFLVKLDRQGNWLRVAHAGNTNPTVDVAVTGTGIMTDSAGNVIVTGWVDALENTDVSVQFGSRSALFNTNDVEQEIFIAKFDSAGNCLWARATGASDPGFERSLAVDGSNNVLVTGVYFSTNDFFALKLNSDGGEVWRLTPGSGLCALSAVVADKAGNVYVGGATYAPVVVDGVTITHTATIDGFVAKIDPAGHVLWARSSGGSGDSFVTGLALDFQTNLVAGGNVEGTNFFGFQFPANPDPTLSRPFVLKLSSAGSNLWLRTSAVTPPVSGPKYGGGAHAVSVDAAGGIYSTGFFQGSLDVDGTVLAGHSNIDVFIAQYDASGNNRWALDVGANPSPTNAVAGRGLASGPDGTIVTGSYAGDGNFGPITLPFATAATAFIGLVPHPAPRLTLRPAGDGLMLDWPLVPAGFALESATNVTGLWIPNAAVPTPANGFNILTLPLSAPQQFFRLRRP